MTKKELLTAFVNGAEHGRGSNLIIVGNKLINYNTVIAERKGNKITLNSSRYSRTTSVNQNMLRQLIPSDMLVEKEFTV